MIRSTILTTTVLAAMTLGWATTAQSNALEIGGKTSATGTLAITSIDPDGGNNDTTTVVLGLLGAYTTRDARWEMGAGLTILGIIPPSNLNGDTGIYNLTGEGRINSDPLGPEENVILYGGAIAGLGIVRSDSGQIGDDEVGVFGPKIGAEFYVSPSTAIQIQESYLWDTEGGGTNNLTVGFKLLFN